MKAKRKPRSNRVAPDDGLAAKAKTSFGKTLYELRSDYISNGGKLYTADEINSQVRKNRGG